ncbi:MAG TPA: hydroxymethylglutaryl-CoA reductase (NADPH) [Thermoanaerobaculia bacterium]|jgi:hydroxymethylglutaryl-CoA reductase (NADPH)|nr:hydroxymethylglutaryl-CoA reductase (NADPH) [Thermoanaerobaculia bacterium]
MTTNTTSFVATAAAAARPTRAELVRSLVEGERRFHQLPKDLAPEEAADIRRSALEEMTRTPLNNIAHHSLDVTRASRRNCENFIGVAQVPMGICGPLRVRGNYVDGDVYVPLATTEAALVASTNRGCTAIREAGGAVVRVEDVGMTRAPVFRTSGIVQTQAFLRWIQDHYEDVRRVTEATSRYIKLLEVRPFAFGTTVFLRFRFDSGDAMGMNMATIACDRVVTDLIEPATGVACIGLSGNYCVDKKPAAINFQEGRGKRIYAEILLEAPVLHHNLRTNARDLVEVQYRKNLLGSIAAGSLGFNAHYANVLAAFFIATGQDPAHVVEGSLGVTCIEARGQDSVFASIFMPDVPLGTVGGGTALDTQREALAMLGVSPDPVRRGEATLRLAEILGAIVLAGELSLMAAFTSQDLARAHEKLGRAEPAGPQPLPA